VKIKITVGAVEVDLDGLDLNRKQLQDLLESCGSIALAVEAGSDEDEHKQPIGFSASLDLDPERNYEPDTSEWFEDSP